MTDYSVVLPVFNESGNLPELHRRLTEVLEPMGSFELIFVDDGSADDSWKGIRSLSTGSPSKETGNAGDPRVRGLRFSRNFGHHYALAAGLEAARGDVVITMDADLQDPPEEIPRLVAELTPDCDTVIGVKAHRSHSAFKQACSRAYMLTMSLVANARAPLNSSLFRVMRTRFVQRFHPQIGPDLFLPTLFARMGGNQKLVEVRHESRFAGEPKYDMARMLRLAAAGLASATRRRPPADRRPGDYYDFSEIIGEQPEDGDHGTA